MRSAGASKTQPRPPRRDFRQSRQSSLNQGSCAPCRPRAGISSQNIHWLTDSPNDSQGAGFARNPRGGKKVSGRRKKAPGLRASPGRTSQLMVSLQGTRGRPLPRGGVAGWQAPLCGLHGLAPVATMKRVGWVAPTTSRMPLLPFAGWEARGVGIHGEVERLHRR
jgi:hypothetical protein